MGFCSIQEFVAYLRWSLSPAVAADLDRFFVVVAVVATTKDPSSDEPPSAMEDEVDSDTSAAAPAAAASRAVVAAWSMLLSDPAWTKTSSDTLFWALVDCVRYKQVEISHDRNRTNAELKWIV